MVHASSSIKQKILEWPIDDVFEGHYQNLIANCRRNLLRVNEPLIRQAFQFGHWAHRNDVRSTGDPYFVHPIEVANIVVNDIGVDDISVVAALLHDVVEDTEVTLETIRAEFGAEIEGLINGLTKIEGVLESRELKQAENSRKLILSMASDVRVILVKFADRLHNMRTITGLRSEKRWRIASETKDFFVPLAHRFGLFAIKNELEDLCLKVMDRVDFDLIAKGLDEKKVVRERYIEQFMKPIQEQLEKKGFNFDIKGRPKSIYSIYNKMKKQGKSLDEIYDLFAIRIILHSKEKEGRDECWRVYSIITDEYTPLPDRFRDFISNPKSNGYQSIHTTVVGPEGRKVEVQIRTSEMDEIAERGLAAHWKYKEDGKYASKGQPEPASESERKNLKNTAKLEDQWYAWVRDVLEAPQDDASDFVTDFRLNLYEEEIHVFTPHGDMITLPKNATPVDFAFQVHTEVGFHCIGAKANDKIMPLSGKLKTGDQVEIITSKKQTPNKDWLKFVVTTKAKTRIKQFLNEKRRKATEQGRELLERKLRKMKIDLNGQMMDRYAKGLKFAHTGDMYYELGVGQFEVDDFIKHVQKGLIQEEKERVSEEKERLHYENFVDIAQQVGKSVLLIEGEVQTNMKIVYATCCNPIPGDEVFGYVSVGNGLRIHRLNCKNASDLLAHHAERVRRVEWGRGQDSTFLANLKVIGTDRIGMFNDISTVISKNLKMNIRSIIVSAEDGIFEGTIVLDVSDLEHLKRLMQRLHSVEGVHDVYRFEG